MVLLTILFFNFLLLSLKLAAACRMVAIPLVVVSMLSCFFFSSPSAWFAAKGSSTVSNSVIDRLRSWIPTSFNSRT